MILVQQKFDNLKSNLKKQIKEIEAQTFDQKDELTIYPKDSSAKWDYRSVLKKLTYISVLQKQVMDDKLERDITKWIEVSYAQKWYHVTFLLLL